MLRKQKQQSSKNGTAHNVLNVKTFILLRSSAYIEYPTVHVKHSELFIFLSDLSLLSPSLSPFFSLLIFLPSCPMLQKNGGCNIMTCSRCRQRFCWLCLKRLSFPVDNGHFEIGTCTQYSYWLVTNTTETTESTSFAHVIYSQHMQLLILLKKKYSNVI